MAPPVILCGIMKRILTLVLTPPCVVCLWHLAAFVFASTAGAQQGGDLQAQILYAFYIEDVNELSSLVQLLSTQQQTNGADDSLRYHLAHARYRIGLLTAQNRSASSDSAFAACINELKPLLERQADNVEALALQSACYSNLALVRGLSAVVLRSRGEERIERAAALAPRNPRVELLRAQATLSYGRSGKIRAGTPDSARALGQLQLAAQVFELSTATGSEGPDWGHAETYLALGRQLQAAGDVIGARNWIEKSLIVAPDFKAAQRQRAALVRQ